MDALTVLVGSNGAGKSSFCRSLEIFFNGHSGIGIDDFYARDDTVEIIVAVTFHELPQQLSDLCRPYVSDGKLTVTRVVKSDEGRCTSALHGRRLRHLVFQAIRESSAIEGRRQYAEIRETDIYRDLPAATSQQAVLRNLEEWELGNPEQCTRELDDGRFFGFSTGSDGSLGGYIELIAIPAIQDPAQYGPEMRNSPVAQVTGAVIRSAIAGHQGLADLTEEAQQRYDEFMRLGPVADLPALETSLSDALRRYVPNASIELSVRGGGAVDIPSPIAEMKLVEDRYSTDVSRTGHGLQRSFVMAMLQHLGARSTTGEPAQVGDQADAEPINLPTLVLMIEEPELYQHPSQQRHIANLLLEMSTRGIDGVARQVQVLYTTHSPLLVGIDRFHQIRRLSKVPGEPGRAMVSTVTQVDGDEVAEDIWRACEEQDINGRQVEQFTWEGLEPRLASIMTPLVGEGFFSDVAVLVEGEGDRAAILAAASVNGHDLEANGISLIPCGGKANIDRPLVIFRKFGIPVYAVWDGDHGKKGAKRRENRRLLNLVGQPPEDWPRTQVAPQFACFKIKLESTIREEIGQDLFKTLLTEAQAQFGMPNADDALKNPAVLERIMRQAQEGGARAGSIESIVDRIIALVPR